MCRPGGAVLLLAVALAVAGGSCRQARERAPGRPHVVRLAAASDLRFALEAFTTRWPDYQPYGGDFDTVIPHLTVAKTDGAPVAALESVLRTGLPVASRATEVWLMEGKADDGWERRAVFPLSAART